MLRDTELLKSKEIDNDSLRQSYLAKMKTLEYYLIPVKPTLFVSFLRRLCKDNILLKDPLFVDDAIFKNKICATSNCVDQILNIYGVNYFVRDLKKEKYLNGPDYLRNLYNIFDLNQYLENLSKKEKKDFFVGEVVMLTLDNKYYVIESLDLKKNEAVINSKTSNLNVENKGSSVSMVLKVKINYLQHLN